MPVEPGQTRAGEPPPEQEAPAAPVVPAAPATPAAPVVPAAPATPAAAVVPAAPRPPHDEHELPDGRYLLAYRSASDA